MSARGAVMSYISSRDGGQRAAYSPQKT